MNQAGAPYPRFLARCLGAWLLILAIRGVSIRTAQMMGVADSALDNGPTFQYRSPLVILWIFAPLTWDVVLFEMWFLFLAAGIALIRAARLRERNGGGIAAFGKPLQKSNLFKAESVGIMGVGIWLLVMGARGALIAFTRYELNFWPLEILAPDGLNFASLWLWPGFLLGGFLALLFGIRRRKRGGGHQITPP